MPQKRPKSMFIVRPRHFRGMNSKVRQEIIGAIRIIEPCSVREIAGRIHRKPETVYYHIDILIEAGMIHEVAKRPAGKRDEALYEATCDRFRFHPTCRTPAFLRDMRRTYSTMIRTTEQQILESVGADGEIRQGRGKNMRVQFYAASLTRKDLDELNRRLDAVREFLIERRSADAGTPHQVMLLMSPSDGREA